MASVTTLLQGVPVWVEHGPGPIVDGAGGFLGTGAIVAVAAHPTDVGVIYVATSGGGVWRTRDATPDNASASWEPVTDGHPSPALGAIAISPLDPNTVFAGTGSFASFGPSGTAVGLYRTTNAGDTWRNLGRAELATLPIRSVLPTSITGAGGQVVLVAALSDPAGTKAGGLFRSDDGGQSFQAHSNVAGMGLPAGDGWALVEDPKQPGLVYAAVGGTAPGIYRFGDAGTSSWSAVATTGIDAGQLAAAQWIRLAVRRDPAGGASTLAVTIVNGGQPVGFYVTAMAPGQEKWSSIPLPDGGADAIEPYSQALWKLALALDPRTGDMYVGGDEGGGVWRCGIADPSHPQWEKVSKSLGFAGSDLSQDADKVPHADLQDLVFDAGGNLLAACDGGIYRLPNPANSPGGAARKWTAIGKAIRNNEAFSMGLDTLNRILSVASADNGTSWQESPGSQRWAITGWGDGGVAMVNNDSPDVSWRYLSDGGLNTCVRFKVDKNNQATAEPVLMASSARPNELGSGLNSVDRKQLVDKSRNPVFNPDGTPVYVFQGGNQVLNNLVDGNSLAGRPSRMLIGSNGLYESLDGGTTISEITLTDPTTNTAVSGVLPIAYGAMDGATPKPEVAYVGAGGKLWLRGPGAAGFAPVTAYPGGSVVHIGVDVTDWKRVYVVDQAHVYRTDDVTDASGQSWQDCTGNLPAMVPDPVVYAQRVLVTHSATGAEVALVGAMGGIYRCLNPADGAGAVWTKFGRNLPGGCLGQDLRHYPRQVRANGSTGDVLAASVYGRGVWTLPSASSVLFQASVLRITGTAPEQYIRLVRNPDVPAQLDVHAPDGAGPNLSFPLTCVQQIIVDCQGGRNSLTLDCSNGPIAVPQGIDYFASGADNSLTLTGGSVPSQVFRITGGTTGLLSAGDMRVHYSGIAQIDGTVHSGRTVVHDVPPPDGLRLSNALLTPRVVSLQILHRRGGDQLALRLANTEDVTLDLTRGGGQVVVTDLDGGPPRLRRLHLLAGKTVTDFRIDTTPPGVEVEIQGTGGQDSVSVGSLTGTGGSLDRVRGGIHISNAAGRTALSVLDGDNPRSTTVTLTEQSLTGLAPAAITFVRTALSGLIVTGSKGGTAFTVEGTGPFPTALTGSGSVNRLDLHASTGLLEYTTVGVDNVHLGAPVTLGSVLSGIVGTVRLHCAATGNLNVTVDDRGGRQQRNVGITDHAVTGLAPAEIDLFPGTNPFLNGLTIFGGAGQVFYSVIDTPPNFSLTLHGQGQDVVNVYRARQDVAVDGARAVTIGSPTLGLGTIVGGVSIGGGASTALSVDDTGTATARNLTMDVAAITGLTAKPIRFDSATLHSVNVRCGSGVESVIVANTVSSGGTELDLGTGQGRVSVRATSGPLVIHGQAGAAQQVEIGSTGEVQKDDLTTIKGEVRVVGHSETVDLVISDAAGKLARRGQMDAANLTRLAPAAILFGPLHSLAVDLSRAGNRLDVTGTNQGAVTVHTGGNDTVDVRTSEQSPCTLLVEGPAAPQQDVLRVAIGGRPMHVVDTAPSGTTPGSIRITYPGGVTSLISFRNIRTVERV